MSPLSGRQTIPGQIGSSRRPLRTGFDHPPQPVPRSAVPELQRCPCPPVEVDNPYTNSKLELALLYGALCASRACGAGSEGGSKRATRHRSRTQHRAGQVQSKRGRGRRPCAQTGKPASIPSWKGEKSKSDDRDEDSGKRKGGWGNVTLEDLALLNANRFLSQDDMEVHQIIPNDEGGEAANSTFNYVLMHK